MTVPLCDDPYALAERARRRVRPGGTPSVDVNLAPPSFDQQLMTVDDKGPQREFAHDRRA